MPNIKHCYSYTYTSPSLEGNYESISNKLRYIKLSTPEHQSRKSIKETVFLILIVVKNAYYTKHPNTHTKKMIPLVLGFGMKHKGNSIWLDCAAETWNVTISFSAPADHARMWSTDVPIPQQTKSSPTLTGTFAIKVQWQKETVLIAAACSLHVWSDPLSQDLDLPQRAALTADRRKCWSLKTAIKAKC